MKNQQKVRNRKSLILVTFLFLTLFITLKIFKKVNFQDLQISGSELFTNEDIVNNSSLNLPTPLIFVKTKYIERELKKNLSLKNVSVNRQILPFGLNIQIKERTPIAYGEKVLNGKKIAGFIDEDGFFINEKYSNEITSGELTSKVFGWEEKFSETLSKILKSQKNNEVEYIIVNFSPSGFLLLEEKVLKTIILGFDPKIIDTQLQIIIDIKNQLNGNKILKKIDNIDLTDPSNPKIKVFKP